MSLGALQIEIAVAINTGKLNGESSHQIAGRVMKILKRKAKEAEPEVKPVRHIGAVSQDNLLQNSLSSRPRRRGTRGG